MGTRRLVRLILDHLKCQRLIYEPFEVTISQLKYSIQLYGHN